MKRLLHAVVGMALVAATATAQTPSVVVNDVGPEGSGRILQEVLARPHRLVAPDTGWFILGRSAQENASLVVLGRTAAIAGRIDGDVIVVGGDLFVRPGAHIAGRAVAIGGGVYPSAIAIIDGGVQSFRDNTFSIAPTADGYQLSYVSLREHASPPLLLPGIYGLRFPTYDRVNGVSLPLGPVLSFASGRGEADFLATYRSDVGKIDPSVQVSAVISRRSRLRLNASRGTFSNDAWIWPNLVNSLSALVLGTDTRNYYRADRAELTVHRLWEWTGTQIEPFVGGLAERAWSVGPTFGEQRGPWSFRGKKDSIGMWRPNPAIDEGTVTSALAGLDLHWQSQGLEFRSKTGGEIGLSSPVDHQFVQVTSDVNVSFATFGEQEYALDVRWVTSPGDTPPAQRFAYMGGSGTLPFNKLLEMGGDELLLIDQRYVYPLLSVRFGMLGTPTLQLRHRMGSAGLTRLPAFEQVIGFGVILTLVRAELLVDPASGRTRLSAGFSFSR